MSDKRKGWVTVAAFDFVRFDAEKTYERFADIGSPSVTCSTKALSIHYQNSFPAKFIGQIIIYSLTKSNAAAVFANAQ